MGFFNNTFKAAVVFGAITIALYGFSPVWAIGGQTQTAQVALQKYQTGGVSN